MLFETRHQWRSPHAPPQKKSELFEEPCHRRRNRRVNESHCQAGQTDCCAVPKKVKGMISHEETGIEHTLRPVLPQMEQGSARSHITEGQDGAESKPGQRPGENYTIANLHTTCSDQLLHCPHSCYTLILPHSFKHFCKGFVSDQEQTKCRNGGDPAIYFARYLVKQRRVTATRQGSIRLPKFYEAAGALEPARLCSH